LFALKEDAAQKKLTISLLMANTMAWISALYDFLFMSYNGSCKIFQIVCIQKFSVSGTFI